MSAVAAGRVTHMDVGNAASPSATPMDGEGRKNVGNIFENGRGPLQGNAVPAAFVGAPPPSRRRAVAQQTVSEPGGRLVLAAVRRSDDAFDL